MNVRMFILFYPNIYLVLNELTNLLSEKNVDGFAFLLIDLFRHLSQTAIVIFDNICSFLIIKAYLRKNFLTIYVRKK